MLACRFFPFFFAFLGRNVAPHRATRAHTVWEYLFGEAGVAATRIESRLSREFGVFLEFRSSWEL